MPDGSAPAKINLALHVTGRRLDGFHLLDSLAVFAGVHDTVTAEPSEALTLSIDGPFSAGLLAEPDNLILRAARALAAAHGIVPRGKLHLRKNLPVASGIGGGSADAAAAVRVLARLWGLEPDRASLQEVAAGLGADVPVCLASVPCRMAGIGEILSPAPDLPPCGLVLVNPGKAVATADVFRARPPSFSAPMPEKHLPAAWPDAAAMAADLARMANDLEAPAIALCPAIADVLIALRATPGIVLARMSGSGATCFGLTADQAAASAAAYSLARPGWWCWGGGLWRGSHS